ncbi:MAG: hypothetical protein ABSG62_11855 [Terracidiphilus sp.]|jgi:hypothetical protein
MIDRFNFYDIYGYLLPGTLLMGIFWLPFGLATGRLPASEVSTTLLLLALAYIAGHVLQTVASVVVPSKVGDGKGELRSRSNLLLDAANSKFSPGFKDDLAKKVKAAFGLEVLGDQPGDLTNRDTAFLEARAYLIRNKAANYVEQFEGLYAMMRGLGCAFLIGCGYLSGWGLSFHWELRGVGLAVWSVLVASIPGALAATAGADYLAARAEKEKDKEKRKLLQEREKAANEWLAVCVLLFASGLGYFLGTWKPLPGRLEFFLWSALPVTLFAGSRCFQAYRGYAQHFAETVWRDFSSLYREDAPPPSKETQDKDRAASS